MSEVVNMLSFSKDEQNDSICSSVIRAAKNKEYEEKQMQTKCIH
jgi:hypothetical protein